MIEFNLTDILSPSQIESIKNIAPNPESIKLIGKDIVFNALGDIPGVSDFKYTDSVVSKVDDYMSENIRKSVKGKLEDLLGTNEVEIRKYTNQAKSLMKLYGSYQECGSLTEFATKMWDGGSMVTGALSNISSAYGLDDAFDIAKDLMGGSMDGIVGSVSSFIDNNFGSGVSGMISGLFGGGSSTSVGGTYGDRIDKGRDLMVLTIQNITTGDVYKSIRFDDSLSDSHSADWEKQNIVGRTAPIFAYNGSSSSMSISMTVMEDLLMERDLEKNLNVLRDLVNPMYVGNLIKKPVARVFIGGLSRTVIFDSVDVDYKNYMIRNGKHTMATVSLAMSVVGKSSGDIYSAKDY